ncbi:addiction module toxin, RelE/StbE family [Desulfitobacterium dichloroeliminans LMG P-21439]|uniref:Addiction module toxin, RelE/StbE family n=1 Tax=Desulfitobacterium dichloroeliminans (strain LMG P-21439 / DCA1) TaxID=871963 RepID=L0FBN1_DESDL|nr:type II toxin-antitoxin system RelE/ParE family toxin [Desulfitobacterium dichloroeliminans]AGA70358.1 addiction module toxin, RelE/StbE family [Desulfitobacterium dichloroeliminans LMG P-21439]
MYKLKVSELAHQDLDKIVSYIAVQLANPKAAGDFLDEVDTCYGYLKSSPLMYAKCQDKRLEKEGYRKLTIKNYVLVYKIDEVSKTVNILRFFYGAQDYVNLI